MSTRSFIGIEDDCGQVAFVFCHHDGYLEYPGVGATLVRFYNDWESARELVGHGGLNSLKESIEKSDFFCRDKGEECVIYHADAPAGIIAECWDDDPNFKDDPWRCIPHAYLCRPDGQWYHNTGDPEEWELLGPAVQVAESEMEYQEHE